MKANKELDKWAAEKLDSTMQLTNGNYVITLPSKIIIDFTLLDARCREIVREHFKIRTVDLYPQDMAGNKWASSANHIKSARGKSIEDAECTCITEIMESEK